MRAFRRRLAPHRCALAIFFTLFLAYGYFHQGGGWNQNSRFAQVRSLVEEGSFSINRFCAYGGEATDKSVRLVRRPLPERIPADAELTGLNGLDIAVYGGRIYPNKPPGVTLLARPAYTVIRHVGRARGADADSWSVLTASAYLTTVFSIGLAGALCGVGFLAISRRLAPEVEERWHVAATLAFGLGTIFFPFATMLYDHVPVATAMLGAFGLAFMASEKSAGEARISPWLLFAAGLVIGFAVVLNYTAALVAVLLGLYVAFRLRRPRPVVFYVLGGVLPAVFLALYHQNAFGGPLVIANTYEHAFFLDPESHFLGVFVAPDGKVALELLFGTKRGLFLASPIMLFALFGLFSMPRRRRPETVFLIAVCAVFFLVNVSFNAWHGGNSFGPRYLVPALPFLALPLAVAFARWPRTGCAVAFVSAAIALLATATDPQVPADVEHPLTGFVLPGLAGENPVSRNAAGLYEPFPHHIYGPYSSEAQWNSFNLGELLFPASLWSLLPLVLLAAAGCALALRRQKDQNGVTEPASPT